MWKCITGVVVGFLLLPYLMVFVVFWFIPSIEMKYDSVRTGIISRQSTKDIAQLELNGQEYVVDSVFFRLFNAPRVEDTHENITRHDYNSDGDNHTLYGHAFTYDNDYKKIEGNIEFIDELVNYVNESNLEYVYMDTDVFGYNLNENEWLYIREVVDREPFLDIEFANNLDGRTTTVARISLGLGLDVDSLEYTLVGDFVSIAQGTPVQNVVELFQELLQYELEKDSKVIMVIH